MQKTEKENLKHNKEYSKQKTEKRKQKTELKNIVCTKQKKKTE